ncbi:tRNA (guanine(46)-N(7))-methyltransferase TrmB [Hoeflea sp. WL0058]|uniref:tRNA (guanine-N(7)-)-methyltransferase n=1 Tax=Flavimaribacter sediminis TaxID=2865987 RepID=A0AAE2ZQQ3_9HYPH|nr:tRNA (guanine(46)-N(7))-methyltransferase TrmB [Flavimaribacter sediminis]MBW8637937.1 tRNA (guanine(46)-N(7))-methyltransferase TrmB [Flavimaribacter sediminis]
MATGRDNQRSFFGRRKGKTLRPKQRQAVDDVLPLYRIDISGPSPADAAGLFEADVDRMRLEIGFGGGEHFLHRAAEQPETGFIGVEPFVNGMAKCAAALAEEPLRNVRLFDEEAALLLDWLPENSVDHVDLLYPDPWPKKRHWKRRFVNEESLDRLARVLKPGGVFCFASDIDTYVNWTLLHCRSHPAFAWRAETAQDWRRPYPGWPGTRYEAKAVREDRTPAYLTFRRV